jgi:inorganic pyrophosphatase
METTAIPLDIMVLMAAPAHLGCLIDVRIIGVIDAEQTQDGKIEKNRILGAAIHSYEHQNLITISDVSKTLLSQVEEFFVSYNSSVVRNLRLQTRAVRKKPSGISRAASKLTRKQFRNNGGQA